MMKPAATDRLFQALLILSVLAFSWLAMMVVHESDRRSHEIVHFGTLRKRTTATLVATIATGRHGAPRGATYRRSAWKRKIPRAIMSSLLRRGSRCAGRCRRRSCDADCFLREDAMAIDERQRPMGGTSLLLGVIAAG